MAKSNYLLIVLLVSIVCLHFTAGGNNVGEQYQVSGIKYQDSVRVKENGNTFKQNEGSRKRELVKQIYTSQVGIRERSSNSGPEVEKYLHYVNLPKGNPWCAAFVCWVFGRAGISNPQSGWSPDLFRAGKVIWDRTESRQDELPAYPPSLATGNPRPR